MSRINKIMVALDFSKVDKKIIKYAGYLNEYLKPQNIYFIHINSSIDLPNEILSELNLSEKATDNKNLEAHVKELGIDNWPNTNNSSIEYIVLEGSPFEQLLRFSHEYKIDLLIVGKKNIENGKGITSQNLARKADGHILFVPEDWNEDPIEEIVVPVDFSDHSKLAVNQIDEIFTNKQDIKFIGVHCFGVPLGFYSSGKTKEEFAEIMASHAERKFKDFFKVLGDHARYLPVYKFDENHEPSKEIMAAAHEQKADLIAIGARGKTNLATMILGSTTENLLKVDHDVPVLVVKKQGENIGFLEALFRLK